MRRKKNIYIVKEDIYTVDEFKKILPLMECSNYLIGNNKGIYYYNIPCSFDIETSSFYRNTEGNYFSYKDIKELDKKYFEKCTCVYVWQFGFNGYVVM